jgi:hypothetical protein
VSTYTYQPLFQMSKESLNICNLHSDNDHVNIYEGHRWVCCVCVRIMIQLHSCKTNWLLVI